MRLLYAFFILFGSLTSCQNKPQKSIEHELMECVGESYRRENVDIKVKMKQLESYLIEQKVLKDSSGQSYYNFFKNLADTNDISVLDILPFKESAVFNSKILADSTCIEDKLSLLDLPRLSDSKAFKLQQKLKDASLDKAKSTNLITLILSVMQPKDFDQLYYKCIVLHLVADLMKSSPFYGLKKYTIEFINKDVLINSHPVNFNQFEDSIRVYVNQKSKTHYIDVTNIKKMGLIADLTQIHKQELEKKSKDIYHKPYNRLSEAERMQLIKRFPLHLNFSRSKF